MTEPTPTEHRGGGSVENRERRVLAFGCLGAAVLLTALVWLASQAFSGPGENAGDRDTEEPRPQSRRSERRQAEARLRELEARIRFVKAALLGATPDERPGWSATLEKLQSQREELMKELGRKK